MFGDRPLLALNYRDDTKNNTDGYKASMYLFLRDLRTGQEIARFGEGHSFVNAFVNGPELNVFASEGSNRDWFQSIYRFTSTDLKTWKRELAIAREGGEHLFNCSVCRDDQGFLMAYESNLPVQFCFKFARSKDLAKWEKIPGLVFAGVDGKEYSACPVIRYFAPYYYVIYLHAAIPGHNGWVSFLARSKDLVTWELSPAQSRSSKPVPAKGSTTPTWICSSGKGIRISTTPRAIRPPGAACAWPCTSVPCGSSSKAVFLPTRRGSRSPLGSKHETSVSRRPNDDEAARVSGVSVVGVRHVLGEGRRCRRASALTGQSGPVALVSRS